jgi:hypothetical protein
MSIQFVEEVFQDERLPGVHLRLVVDGHPILEIDPHGCTGDGSINGAIACLTENGMACTTLHTWLKAILSRDVALARLANELAIGKGERDAIKAAGEGVREKWLAAEKRVKELEKVNVTPRWFRPMTFEEIGEVQRANRVIEDVDGKVHLIESSEMPINGSDDSIRILLRWYGTEKGSTMVNPMSLLKSRLFFRDTGLPCGIEIEADKIGAIAVHKRWPAEPAETPVPKWRPFTHEELLLCRGMSVNYESGRRVKIVGSKVHTASGREYVEVGIEESGGVAWIGADTLLARFTFNSGDPCGVDTTTEAKASAPLKP